MSAPSVLVTPEGHVLDEAFVRRFLVRTKLVGECCEWQGYRDPRGYGRVRAGGRAGKSYLTHRISWLLATGRMPPSTVPLMHSCDNPPCLRADHLSEGTPLQNARDAVARGLLTYERRDTCSEGHDLTDPANAYVRRKDGVRLCRPCRSASERRRRESAEVRERIRRNDRERYWRHR